MEKQIIEKIQNKLPMDIKKFAISMGFLTMVLTACGKNVVDTTPTNPTPTQTVETQVTPVEEDPEVTIPVVEPTNPTNNTETDPVVEPVVEDKYPDATMVQTGEHEYTIHIDCPDNSNAILTPDSVPFYEVNLSGDSYNYGISAELINAIFTYGLQTNPSNPTLIDIESYVDKPVNMNIDFMGNVYNVLTSDTTKYPDNYGVILISALDGNQNVSPNSSQCFACATLLKDALINCDGNITCALTRYNIGPENWDKVMEECMNATGLTAEEIYANYDSNYVLQYDTLGLGNPDFANGVLQYVNTPITITYFDANGNIESEDTYSLDRIKTYGSLQP